MVETREEFAVRRVEYAAECFLTLPNFPKEIAYTNTKEDKLKIILGERLISVIQDNGFEINENKVRLQHKNLHQEVTELTVNHFPNVKRDYVKKISSMLHAWEKFGLDSVQERYIEKGSKELGITTEKVPHFQEVLRGKINFLGMVRGKDNEIYRKYLEWYRILSNRQ